MLLKNVKSHLVELLESDNPGMLLMFCESGGYFICSRRSFDQNDPGFDKPSDIQYSMNGRLWGLTNGGHGWLWRTIALDGPCSCALACLLSWHWQTNRQADRQTSNRPRRYKETQSKLDLTWPALASLVTGLLSFSEIPREYCSRLLCMYYLNTLYIITSALKHIGVNLRLTIMTNIVSGHLLLL